jgi:hypothetical protein
VLCGLLGSLAHNLVFVVSTVGVGSYGVAIFVCGIIPATNGGSVAPSIPLARHQPEFFSQRGGAGFVVVFLAMAVVGGTAQYVQHAYYSQLKKGSQRKPSEFKDSLRWVHGELVRDDGGP